jgi:hypothetical protein
VRDLISLITWALLDLFRSRTSREAELLAVPIGNSIRLA